MPSFLRWSERGYRAYGPGHKLIDLVVGGHAQGDVLIPIFFGCWMAWVMQQTSKDVRSVQGEGGDLAACAAYADDGAAFGHGSLLWRKHFRANFAKKDNQYVDSGRTLAECIRLFVDVGMVRADYRIICSDWSDDLSEEEKELARKGGGAALPRGVKYLGMYTACRVGIALTSQPLSNEQRRAARRRTCMHCEKWATTRKRRCST